MSDQRTLEGIFLPTSCGYTASGGLSAPLILWITLPRIARFAHERLRPLMSPMPTLRNESGDDRSVRSSSFLCHGQALIYHQRPLAYATLGGTVVLIAGLSPMLILQLRPRPNWIGLCCILISRAPDRRLFRSSQATHLERMSGRATHHPSLPQRGQCEDRILRSPDRDPGGIRAACRNRYE